MKEYILTITEVDSEDAVVDVTINADEVINFLGRIITGIGDKEEIEEDAEAPKKRKKGTCKICGKPGHRRTTCPQNNGGDDSGKRDLGSMSEVEYDDVKESQSHDLNGKQISDEMNISIREVNKALQSTSYERYLSMK